MQGSSKPPAVTLGNCSGKSLMQHYLRLGLALLSGIAGLAAIFLLLRPGMVPQQNVMLLGVVTVLTAATIFSTTMDVLRSGESGNEVAGPQPATQADREVHGEVIKVIGVLKSQQEATNSFSAVLDKARDQLFDNLDTKQVRLVISYLMIENENMRNRTAELQGSLESSQRQIEKLKSNLAAAEAQGLSDPLTSLKNRRGFDLALATEIASAKAGSKPLSLIMADIDHFKSINDRYGHPAGDDVIKWFAKLLSINMKGRDTVARYGGEEFAIILPQTGLANAATLAEQIRQQLERELWKKPGAPNTMLRVTASFGLAELEPGESTSNLISRADAKLYESKQNGRNRVTA